MQIHVAQMEANARLPAPPEPDYGLPPPGPDPVAKLPPEPQGCPKTVEVGATLPFAPGSTYGALSSPSVDHPKKAVVSSVPVVHVSHIYAKYAPVDYSLFVDGFYDEQEDDEMLGVGYLPRNKEAQEQACYEKLADAFIDPALTEYIMSFWDVTTLREFLVLYGKFRFYCSASDPKYYKNWFAGFVEHTTNIWQLARVFGTSAVKDLYTASYFNSHLKQLVNDEGSLDTYCRKIEAVLCRDKSVLTTHAVTPFLLTEKYDTVRNDLHKLQKTTKKEANRPYLVDALLLPLDKDMLDMSKNLVLYPGSDKVDYTGFPRCLLETPAVLPFFSQIAAGDWQCFMADADRAKVMKLLLGKYLMAAEHAALIWMMFLRMKDRGFVQLPVKLSFEYCPWSGAYASLRYYYRVRFINDYGPVDAGVGAVRG
jgi:hypothetical protein